MSCQFIESCPSRSGWCDSFEGYSSKCVPFLLNAYENLKAARPQVVYLCDRRACKACASINPCRHTGDISHAKNFELFGEVFVEREQTENKRSFSAIHADPVGPMGTPGVCPQCGGRNLNWDPESDTSSCLKCGWTI